jgi:hypothetical protein
MAAVAAVPADAGALGFHPSSDTRAELVNCSIKQAKPDTSPFAEMGTLAYFFSCNPWPSIAMKRLFKDSASVGWAKIPSRITV